MGTGSIWLVQLFDFGPGNFRLETTLVIRPISYTMLAYRWSFDDSTFIEPFHRPLSLLVDIRRLDRVIEPRE